MVKTRGSQARCPAPPVAQPFPTRGPRSAEPPQAVALPGTGDGLEPFQAGNGFSLLDLEMTIYLYN